MGAEQASSSARKIQTDPKKSEVVESANGAYLTIKDWAAQNFDRLRESLGTDPACFLDTLHKRTSFREEQEDLDGALKFYNEVLDGQGKLRGPDQALTFSFFRKLAPQNLKPRTLNRSFKLYK